MNESENNMQPNYKTTATDSLDEAVAAYDKLKADIRERQQEKSDTENRIAALTDDLTTDLETLRKRRTGFESSLRTLDFEIEALEKRAADKAGGLGEAIQAAKSEYTRNRIKCTQAKQQAREKLLSDPRVQEALPLLLATIDLSSLEDVVKALKLKDEDAQREAARQLDCAMLMPTEPHVISRAERIAAEQERKQPAKSQKGFSGIVELPHEPSGAFSWMKEHEHQAEPSFLDAQAQMAMLRKRKPGGEFEPAERMERPRHDMTANEQERSERQERSEQAHGDNLNQDDRSDAVEPSMPGAAA